MRLELFIAGRFLFRSRTTVAQRFFTVLSVVNVAFSVMLFLLIHLVMNGFANSLAETLMGVEPPVMLRMMSGEKQEDIKKRLEHFSQKNTQWHFTHQQGATFDGLIQVAGENTLAAKVIMSASGVRLTSEGKRKIYWFDDPENKNARELAKNQIVVGIKLYEKLPFLPGEKENITIINPVGDIGPAGDLVPQTADFYIAGVLDTGFSAFDATAVFVSEEGLERLASAGLVKRYFEIYPKDKNAASHIKSAWLGEYPDDAQKISVWSDHNDNRLRALKLERVIFHLIFGIVLVISGVNLGAIARLNHLSRRRDGAILEALGMRPAQLLFTHIIQGAWLGLIGAAGGIVLAALVLLVQSQGINIIPLNGYGDVTLVLNPALCALVLFVTPLFAILLSLGTRDNTMRSRMEILRET